MKSRVLGNSSQGLAFVISAPAGTGKTTLAHRLTQEFMGQVVMSVSCTTRPPRAGEIPDKDYFFITAEAFEKKIAEGDFLEYVKLYGHYYGTSRAWVLKQLSQGKHVLLTIDTQGALQLKKMFPAVFIFIRPPSFEELRKRLTLRQTESPEKIEERLDWSQRELEEAKSYDYNIINDDIDVAYQILRSILIAEEHRIERKN